MMAFVVTLALFGAGMAGLALGLTNRGCKGCGGCNSQSGVCKRE